MPRRKPSFSVSKKDKQGVYQSAIDLLYHRKNSPFRTEMINPNQDATTKQNEKANPPAQWR
jgi:hypothetical protein